MYSHFSDAKERSNVTYINKVTLRLNRDEVLPNAAFFPLYHFHLQYLVHFKHYFSCVCIILLPLHSWLGLGTLSGERGDGK